jgi:hypothetical protein
VPFGSDVGEMSLFTDKIPNDYFPLHGQLQAIANNVVLSGGIGSPGVLLAVGPTDRRHG